LSTIYRFVSGLHMKVSNEMAPKIDVTVDHMKSYAQARSKQIIFSIANMTVCY
jgi:hypothetical protein